MDSELTSSVSWVPKNPENNAASKGARPPAPGERGVGLGSSGCRARPASRKLGPSAPTGGGFHNVAGSLGSPGPSGGGSPSPARRLDSREGGTRPSALVPVVARPVRMCGLQRVPASPPESPGESTVLSPGPASSERGGRGSSHPPPTAACLCELQSCP